MKEGGASASLTDLRIEKDGSLLVSGYDLTFKDGKLVSHALVLRFTGQGVLDKSFGEQGIFALDTGEFLQVNSIAEQSNGRILLMGGLNNNTAFVARLTPDGKLDETFGYKGVARATLLKGGGVYFSSFSAVGGAKGTLLVDDSILVAGGYQTGVGTFTELGLVRFTKDGALDKSFADQGIAHVPVLGYSSATSVAIDSRGRFVLGGASATGFAMARLLPNGLLDRAFGQGGIINRQVGNAPSGIRDLAVGADGKLVGVGEALAPGRITLSRFLEDGEKESPFGKDGLAELSLADKETGSRSQSIIVLPDGKLLVSGEVEEGCGNDHFLLARFMPTGAPDLSFGAKGKLIQRFPTAH
jgi:uncharacterized delta-60 repeat protein